MSENWGTSESCLIYDQLEMKVITVVSKRPLALVQQRTVVDYS